MYDSHCTRAMHEEPVVNLLQLQTLWSRSEQRFSASLYASQGPFNQVTPIDIPSLTKADSQRFKTNLGHRAGLVVGTGGTMRRGLVSIVAIAALVVSPCIVWQQYKHTEQPSVANSSSNPWTTADRPQQRLHNCKPSANVCCDLSATATVSLTGATAAWLAGCCFSCCC